MATKEITNPIEQLDKCIERLRKRGRKLKERVEVEDVIVKVVEKKKEPEDKKQEYKSFMKVASVVAVLFFGGLWVSSLYVPNIYDVVIALLESFTNLGFDDSSGLEHFVN